MDKGKPLERGKASNGGASLRYIKFLVTHYMTYLFPKISLSKGGSYSK